MGRVLEPEVMDDDLEVDAYLDGVATAHLDHLDGTYIDAVLALGLRRRARVLDMGTGTGAIPVKLAAARPDLKIVGIDLSAPMLRQARARARREGVRVEFRKGNARKIPFLARSFDAVLSNSLIHHLPDAVPAFDEIARVVRADGAVYVRDLRRPPDRFISSHVGKHGRHYRGLMRRQFRDSVRAAYTLREIRAALAASRIDRAEAHRVLDLYWVIERRGRWST